MTTFNVTLKINGNYWKVDQYGYVHGNGTDPNDPNCQFVIDDLFGTIYAVGRKAYVGSSNFFNIIQAAYTQDNTNRFYLSYNHEWVSFQDGTGHVIAWDGSELVLNTRIIGDEDGSCRFPYSGPQMGVINGWEWSS